MGKNSVVFKGRKDGIDIVLDESLSFDNLIEIFKSKVSDAEKFFGAEKSAVTFSGRLLSDEEERILLDIISQQSSLNVSFVEKKPVVRRQLETVFDASNNMTYFHKGSLRSGQEIRYDGSVVVIGDVNPGGEITAAGNILVLGAVRGMVHAGASGNEDCYVAALDLRPIQLRIADIITYIPEEKAKSKKQKTPSYAYVKEGLIYVESLAN